MAVTTYAELKTAIGVELDRTDLASYTGDFVKFAEGQLNRDLRHRKMVTSTDLTPASNVCTLPTDYLNYIRVVELGAIRRELEFITPSVADQMYPTRPAGLASHFMIVGDSLTALPLSSNDIELTYRQKIPTLSDSNTSNWLLATHPELYLRASVMQGLMFINETSSTRFSSTVQFVQKMIEELNSESEMAQYAHAAIYMSGPTP